MNVLLASGMLKRMAVKIAFLALLGLLIAGVDGAQAQTGPHQHLSPFQGAHAGKQPHCALNKHFHATAFCPHIGKFVRDILAIASDCGGVPGGKVPAPVSLDHQPALSDAATPHDGWGAGHRFFSSTFLQVNFSPGSPEPPPRLS
ncbi:MAG: hypothetical protein COV67_05465 [Nitrospinae bacterium CG11_big_fil_rev_8_21_14_0_20_56_8]|nr:MAG: hypothetical protein COV67_05465 [Nitrospinae bacterium CG11_big_fil_rev_8_21_14_0_20_56_8]